MRLIPVGIVLAAFALTACEGTIVTPSEEDVGLDVDGDSDAPSNSDDDDGDDGSVPDLRATTTLTFTESRAEPLNPERGYYVQYDLLGGGNVARIRASGSTLGMAIVNLENYRDRSLDSAILASIEQGFARARSAGVKVIVRFTYNHALAADAPKARMLRHLEQLGPILQDNADVIALMQAGFIGAWGEWHSSTNGLDNDDDRAEILDAILTALPASRSVAVRTPMYKAAFLPGGALEEAEGFTGSARARIGHHNDCFLASDTDLGTFASPVDRWIDYVADDGRFTPVGGETCVINTARTNCASALAEMERQHWSYLNQEYKTTVIAAWEAEGCGDNVRRRLGYRFAAERLAHTETVAPGGVLAVELEIRNSGFASPYNKRPVELVLSSGNERHVVRLAQVDARRWAAGKTTKLSTRLRIPASLTPGTYALSLRLPDDDAGLTSPHYAIQLANEGMWVASTGDNLLARAVVVDPAATGAVDPSATQLVELR